MQGPKWKHKKKTKKREKSQMKLLKKDGTISKKKPKNHLILSKQKKISKNPWTQKK